MQIRDRPVHRQPVEMNLGMFLLIGIIVLAAIGVVVTLVVLYQRTGVLTRRLRPERCPLLRDERDENGGTRLKRCRYGRGVEGEREGACLIDDMCETCSATEVAGVCSDFYNGRS